MICYRCKIEMKIGKAIDTGPGRSHVLYCCDPGPLTKVELIDVWKCPKCGHSEDLK